MVPSPGQAQLRDSCRSIITEAKVEFQIETWQDIGESPPDGSGFDTL